MCVWGVVECVICPGAMRFGWEHLSLIQVEYVDSIKTTSVVCVCVCVCVCVRLMGGGSNIKASPLKMKGYYGFTSEISEVSIKEKTNKNTFQCFTELHITRRLFLLSGGERTISLIAFTKMKSGHHLSCQHLNQNLHCQSG